MKLNLNKFAPAQDELLTTVEAGKFLKMSVAWFTQDRFNSKFSGSAPRIPFIKLGTGSKAAVRYRMADLRAFLDKGCVA